MALYVVGGVALLFGIFLLGAVAALLDAHDLLDKKDRTIEYWRNRAQALADPHTVWMRDSVPASRPLTKH
jgi:hypothetical protein